MKTTLLYFILLIATSTFAQLGDDILIEEFLNSANLVLADVDGDGLKDVISGEVKWYKQLPGKKFGDGTVIAPLSRNVWADDLNEDGFADLVVTSEDGIVYLQNLGNGTFDNPVILWTTSVEYIYFGDFNFDGVKDIANQDGWRVFNIVDGSFGPFQEIPGISKYPQLTDLDGDGLIDMLLVQSEDIYLALNNGNNGFNTPEEIASASWQDVQFSLADLDGDGDEDIVAFGGRRTIILRNLGDGTLGFPQGISFGPNDDYDIIQQRITDLNNDGRLDIVMCSDKYIGWITQDESQEFNDAISIYEFRNIGFLDAEDFDLDGTTDLIFNTESGLNWNGSPHLNDERIGYHRLVGGIGTTTPEYTIGDVDGDGETDWVIGTHEGLYWRKNLNNSDRFSGLLPIPAVSNYKDDHIGNPLLRDKDGDGDLDVFYRRTGNLTMSEFDAASQSFVGQKEWINSDSIWTDFTIVDFNNDGDLDVLSTTSFSDGLKVWINDGNDEFVSTILSEKEDIDLFDFFDIDQDGDLDIVAIFKESYPPEVFCYQNNNGNFTEISANPANTPAFRTVIDLYGTNELYALTYNNGEVMAYPFDATSLTISAEGFLLNDFYISMNNFNWKNLIDFDGDGDLDWLSTSYNYVLENNGETFEETISMNISTNLGGGRFFINDFTNDGYLDLAITPHIYSGSADGFSFDYHSSIQSTPVRDLGDLDGDGDDDLVTTLESGDNLQIYWSENYDGNGNFSNPIAVAWLPFTNDLVKLYDYEDDGDLDIVGGRFLYLNDGNADFVGHPLNNNSSFLYLTSLADINGDGTKDVFRAIHDDLSTHLFDSTNNEFIEGDYISLATPVADDFEAVFNDVDEDGDLDFFIVLANGNIEMVENQNGNISLPFQLIASNNRENSQIIFEDVNLDGVADLIYIESVETLNQDIMYVKWLPGIPGSELFEEARVIGSLPDLGTRKIIFEDFNQDGLADIVFSDKWFAQTPNNFQFTGPFDLDSEYNYFGNYNVGVSDLNQDGFADLLLSYHWNEFHIEGEVSTIAGHKRVLNASTKSNRHYLILKLDYDLDGDLDLIVGKNNVLLWMENVLVNQKSEFKSGEVFLELDSEEAVTNLQTADLNGDGLLDLAIGYGEDMLWAAHAVDEQHRFSQVWYIDNFSTGTQTINSIFPKDLEEDGDMDLIQITDSGETFMFVNDGAAEPQFEKMNFPSTLSDIVFFNVANEPTGNLYGKEDDKFYRFTNQGNLSFGGANVIPNSVINCDEALSMQDLDLDNLTDYVYSCGDDIKILFGEGNNNFEEVAISNVPASNFPIKYWIIDLNNDYLLDIVAKINKDDFYLSLQETPRQFGEWILEPTTQDLDGNENIQLTIGDFDQDFDMDIAFISREDWHNGDIQKIIWKKNFTNNPTIISRSFFDENENMEQDTNEINLNNVSCSLAPDNIQAYANQNGESVFYVDPGNYELSINLPERWELSTDFMTYDIDIATGLVDSQIVRNFGLIPAIDTLEAKSFLTSALMRCFRDVPFWVNFQNTGTEIISGDYVLIKHPAVEFLDANILPDTIIGDSLIWHFDTLYPTYEQNYQLTMTMPDETFVDELIAFESFVLDIDTMTQDTILLGEFTHAENLRCAVDPNDKRVQPARGDSLAQNYTLFEEELFYTIRFQNTGNDTAFNIRIADQLDENLAWETFTPIAASHPYYVTLDENGLVNFEFKNILLVDSLTNEPGSHGFVSYSIFPKEGLAENTSIENTAGIYFDFNAPIITNTTENTMVSVLDSTTNTQEQIITDFASIYPNPLGQNETLIIITDRPMHLNLRLTDPTGQLVEEWGSTGIQHTQHIEKVASGVYFLEIIDRDNPSNLMVEKIVIMD